MELTTAIAWMFAVATISYLVGNERGYNEGRKFGWLNGRLDTLVEQKEKQNSEETEWWQRGDPPPWEAE